MPDHNIEATNLFAGKNIEMSDMPTLSIKTPGWVSDFKAFIMRGNVVDMAVGIVIGAAFTGIVKSLVSDLINPIIGLATGGVDFSNHFIVLKGVGATTLEAAQKAGDVTLNYGEFINTLINFFIIAIVIFWLVRMVEKVYKTPTATAKPTPSETLLGEIRDLLKEKKA